MSMTTLYTPELKARVTRIALSVRKQCKASGDSLTKALHNLAVEFGITSGGTIYSWLRALDEGKYELPPENDLPADESASSTVGDGENGGNRPPAVLPDNPDEADSEESPLFTPDEHRPHLLADPEASGKELQRRLEAAKRSQMAYFADLARIADYAKTISSNVVLAYTEDRS